MRIKRLIAIAMALLGLSGPALADYETPCCEPQPCGADASDAAL